MIKELSRKWEVEHEKNSVYIQKSTKDDKYFITDTPSSTPTGDWYAWDGLDYTRMKWCNLTGGPDGKFVTRFDTLDQAHNAAMRYLEWVKRGKTGWNSRYQVFDDEPCELRDKEREQAEEWYNAKMHEVDTFRNNIGSIIPTAANVNFD